MALTLAELAKVEKDPLRAYVIINMLRDAPAMNVISWEPVSSLKVAGLRWRNLPDVATRSINEGYTESTGDLEQVWESVYGFGGDISYDRIFDAIKDTVVDLKKVQTDMKLKAMNLAFNDYLINGDPGVDPKGFAGLKWRVAHMPSRQTVYFAGAAAAALDPTAAVANARAFIDSLEKMFFYTNSKNLACWFMNEGVQLGIGRALRYVQASGGNWLSVTKDQFDRPQLTLWEKPIYDSGLKKDQTTEIITETEQAGDGGLDATSIYGLSTDEQQGIQGAQLTELNPYDPLAGGELSTRPAKMLRIDWWIGLVSMGSYGITRGVNLEGASNWT